MHVLINALHTTTGGGLAYLNKVMPYLAKQPWQVTLLCQASVREKLAVPANWTVREVAPMDFWQSHVYEQLVLPLVSRRWGVAVTWCNANYVPLLGVRPILTLHTNPQVQAYARSAKEKGYWIVLRFLTKLSFWRCQKVVSVARYLLPLYGAKPGLKDVLAAPGVDAVVAKDAPRDPNLLVAVGDVYVQKNYPLLIEAFALLHKEMPKTKLKIIGNVVDAAEGEKIAALVAEHKLEKAVSLPEPLPHEETLSWLRKAQVVPLPSTVESFSMVMVEAMGCGAPVVAADVPCQREVGGNAVVYVPLTGRNDAAAYGMALYSLMTDTALWDMFHQRGKEQVKRLTWAETAKGIVTAVEGVVAKNSA